MTVKKRRECNGAERWVASPVHDKFFGGVDRHLDMIKTEIDALDRWIE
jgi:hypothetical protein